MNEQDKTNKMWEIVHEIKGALPSFRATRYTLDEGRPYDVVCPEMLQYTIDKLVEELAIAKADLVLIKEQMKHSILVIDTHDEEEELQDE